MDRPVGQGYNSHKVPSPRDDSRTLTGFGLSKESGSGWRHSSTGAAGQPRHWAFLGKKVMEHLGFAVPP
jgi:hypothetical protein